MSVENRGTRKAPRWRYAFTIRGVRYRAAVPEARTKYEAEQAEVEAKKAVFEGRYQAAAGEEDFMTFVREVFLPWSKANKRSWYDDERWADVAVRWFGSRTFAQISPLLVEKFKRERRDEDTVRNTKRSPATVNRELEILSKVFNLAIDHGVTSENPCRKVRRYRLDNRRTRYLLDEEEPLLLAQLVGDRAHLRRPVVVALGTGMRRGDQLSLRKSKVDFQRNVIYVPNSKTGREYAVPMSKEVRRLMLELVREHPESEHVFVNPKTGAPYTDFKKGFAEACRLAKITDLRWHDLRHTFGTRLAEAGCSEATIAELMGHADPKTTRRYTHATERAKHAAVEAVGAFRRKACPKSAPKEKRPTAVSAVSR